jgi:hypothetical protein
MASSKLVAVHFSPPGKFGGQYGLRITNELPTDRSRDWRQIGNVFLELVDGSTLRIIQKLDNKGGDIKNPELAKVFTDQLQMLSEETIFTPKKDWYSI